MKLDMETTNNEMTIGNRIDHTITWLNNLPASYLTGAFVGICVGFAFLTLNIGGKDAEVNYDASVMKPQFSRSSRSAAKNDDEPQPKWQVLKVLNIAASAGFLFSVFKFLSNASTYWEDSKSLIKFLTVWSVFCLYFFGFFGISFINPDELDREVSNGGRKKR